MVNLYQKQLAVSRTGIHKSKISMRTNNAIERIFAYKRPLGLELGPIEANTRLSWAQYTGVWLKGIYAKKDYLMKVGTTKNA